MAKKLEDRPYGPGNTVWFVDDQGEIIKCRWNDVAWSNRTFVNISGEQRISSWEILKLINDAYKMGMDDQKIIIKNALGVN